MSKIAPTLAERLKDPKVQAEIKRHSAKLTAEEHGWVVLEPKHATALNAVVRAAKKYVNGPADPLGKNLGDLLRALARLSRASEKGGGR